MGAWEEMNEEERKVNCIIDLMNTLRFLCGITEESLGDYSLDLKHNQILVFGGKELYDLAGKLERVPEILEDDTPSATDLTHIMQIWYRGVKIYCYLNDENAKKFQTQVDDIVSDLIFDDTEDEGDGDDDD